MDRYFNCDEHQNYQLDSVIIFPQGHPYYFDILCSQCLSKLTEDWESDNIQNLLQKIRLELKEQRIQKGDKLNLQIQFEECIQSYSKLQEGIEELFDQLKFLSQQIQVEENFLIEALKIQKPEEFILPLITKIMDSKDVIELKANMKELEKFVRSNQKQEIFIDSSVLETTARISLQKAWNDQQNLKNCLVKINQGLNAFCIEKQQLRVRFNSKLQLSEQNLIELEYRKLKLQQQEQERRLEENKRMAEEIVLIQLEAEQFKKQLELEKFEKEKILAALPLFPIIQTSKILADLPLDQQIFISSLHTHIKQQNFDLKLIYSGGFVQGDDTIAKFQEKCSMQGPTLTFIKSDRNYVFGGYSKQQFYGNGLETPDPSMESFIFSVNNKKVLNISSPAIRSIYNSTQYVLVFGLAGDIVILDNFKTAENWSILGDKQSSFTIGLNLPVGSQEGKDFLGGSSQFQVLGMQVYQIV